MALKSSLPMSNSVVNKNNHVSSDTNGEEEDSSIFRNTRFKVKLETPEVSPITPDRAKSSLPMSNSVINKHVIQGEDSSIFRNTRFKVKLETPVASEKPLITYRSKKRSRELQDSLVVHNSKKPTTLTKISFAEQTVTDTIERRHESKAPTRLTKRWSPQKFGNSEQTLADVLKEKGASLEKPVSRHELRRIARKKIGDTGLLDHLLKYVDGKVTPNGIHRFRRCYNTQGTLEYWLESADMIKIKRESGTPDPSWIPPSWWKRSEETEEMKDLRNWRVKVDKQIDDLMSWRIKTEKQITEISNTLSSTQCVIKELVTWKGKAEKQLAGITNSQANGSWRMTSFSADLDDFIGKGFEPWDDFIDALPEAFRTDSYLLTTNLYKGSFDNHMWFEEQPLLINTELQTTERLDCMAIVESRSSEQEKVSSVTADEETLEELVTWKAKAEQKLNEISNALLSLQGQS